MLSLGSCGQSLLHGQSSLAKKVATALALSIRNLRKGPLEHLLRQLRQVGVLHAGFPQPYRSCR